MAGHSYSFAKSTYIIS